MVMQPIFHFARLVRLPNLLFVAAIQYGVRWCIIHPSMQILIEGWIFDLQMTDLQFFLFVLSNVLITGAGYIINDYFDLKIDRVNRPSAVIVGLHIKRRVAMGAHIVMNILGLGLALLVYWQINKTQLIFIPFFALISLWYYSTYFKYIPLAGNLIVSVLAGLLVLLPGLAELPLLYARYGDVLGRNAINLNFIAWWIVCLSVVLGLITLLTEIIKDIADMEGDRQAEAETVPLKWGIKITRILVSVIALSISSGTLALYKNYLGDSLSAGYILLGIVLPLSVITYKIWHTQTRKSALFLVSLGRMAAIASMGYMLVFWYMIKFGIGE